ncbi:MAG TPA: OmpA family protein [Bryobacteraceae bacterium]|nr:OmpA family protein [Bryobacteraceae bacterium]
MKTKTLNGAILTLFFMTAAWSQPPQQAPEHMDPQPIYRVTVVSRTLPAINYEHRGGPTMIDFEGTVLLAKARGHAVVEAKRGRVVIDAKFDHLEAPTRFGREYLTYVLWAITPEGRPKNLGELVVDSGNKAKTSVSTELQALGLMVTAEPYYAVQTPSDVVVLENVVRPDTIGLVEPVNAKYDLLPRGQYTMIVNPDRFRTVGPEAEALPYDRYEAVLELYQAQNAVQIARSLGADRYAPDTLSKAEGLLSQAQDMQSRKMDTHAIVSRAREAAQMAEDARTIAVKRSGEDRQRAQQDENQARVRAQADEQRLQAQAVADREAAERERVERERLAAEQAQAEQADAERARAIAYQQQAQAQSTHPAIEARAVPLEPSADQRQNRAELLSRMNSMLSTRDTPRGLVATVPEPLFDVNRNSLQPAAAERLARIGNIIASHRGLSVSVEGYTDDRGNPSEDREVSQRRAQAVRDALVAAGVNLASIRAAGLGRERPLASNATTSGREENRRVEIVVSGPSIGQMPLWDRGYPLSSRH